MFSFGTSRIKLAIGTAAAVLILGGCSGGGGGGNGTAAKTASGHYLDSAVEGAHYICGRYEGNTDKEGRFKLEANRSCTFSLNGVTIREAAGTDIFDGVYLLEKNLTVASILLTLDKDGNPDNGIQIPKDGLGCITDPLPKTSELKICLDGNVSDYNGTAYTPKDAKKHILETLAAHTPEAIAQTLTTPEDTALPITLEGTDPQGDVLSCSIATEPEHGTLEGEGCEVVYRPAANYNGEDRFTFQVSDGSFTSTAAEVNITVSPVNDAPEFNTSLTEQTLEEDFTPVTIDLSASDVDGDPLSYSVSVADDTLLSASLSGSQLTISPVANAHGSTEINITVSDGSLSASRSFTVTVTPVNDAPVLQAVADLSLSEDFGSRTVELNASDVDGDQLSYSVSLSDDSPVSATISGSILTINSLPNANGEANITVSVSDGSLSASQSFTVTVTPVNDAPVFTSIPDQSIDEDSGALTVELNASDPEGDPITFSATGSDDAIATVAVNGTELSITPLPNASGTITVNVTASDSIASTARSFTVTIRPVNDAPTLQPVADLNLSEDFGSVTVELNASDVDDTQLNFSVTQSASGVLNASLSGTTLTLSSLPNANGSTTVTVSVSDGNLSAQQSFTVTVNPVNDAPEADDFTVYVTTGTSGNSIALAPHVRDVDNDRLQVTAFTPLDGLSQDGDLGFLYDNNGTEGSFSFTYTVADPDGLEANGTVTLIVSQEPVYPSASDDSVSMNEDNGSVTVDVLANDTNATSVSAAEILSGEGTVVINPDDTLTYTPPVDYSGTVEIRYTVRSSTGHEANATLTITVLPVNDAPVIRLAESNDTIDEPQSDLTYTVIYTMSDVESNDTLRQDTSLDCNVTGDAVTIAQSNTQSITLAIPAYTNGTCDLTISADDGNLTTTATFVLKILPVASAPRFPDQSVRAYESTSTKLVPFVSPVDESWVFEIIDEGDTSIATVSLTDNNHSLDIEGHALGDSTVRLRVYNEANRSLSADADLSIHVANPNNQAPTATDYNLSVEVDQILSKWLEAHDDDGDPLHYAIHDAPLHGTVVIDGNGNFRYEPDDEYVGPDHFVYLVSDGDLNTTATVTITVHPSEHTGYDSDRLLEVPISADDFDALNALTPPIGQKLYRYDFDYRDGKVQVEVGYFVILDSDNIYDAEHNETIPYSTEGNTVIIVDENGDTEFKWKYLGEVNASAWLADRNLSLPGSPVVYASAYIEPKAEYDLWDEPEYSECNESGCTGGYSTLEEFAEAATFDANTTGEDIWKMKQIWVRGYDFMLAEGSDFANDDNGTIVRVGHYYDTDRHTEVAVVTLADAGTWRKLVVDGTTYLVVTPDVYGISEIRIFALADDGLVHAGEYRPANRAAMEYDFDETTAYMMANALMPRKVDLESNLSVGEEEFLSFNTLPTLSFLQDTEFHRVSQYTDRNGQLKQEIEVLRYDSNGTMTFTEGNETESFDYALNNNIVTIDDPVNGDLKLVEIITDAAEISQRLEINVSALGSDPVLYRLAFVNNADTIWPWDEAYKDDNNNTYNDFNLFMETFKEGDLPIAWSSGGQNGDNRIVYAGEINDSAGTLKVIDGNGETVTPYAGSWTLRTVHGEQVLTFDITVEHHGDYSALLFAEDCGNQICLADFEAKDTGTEEYWVDTATSNAIADYLATTGEEYEMSSHDVPISRDIEGLAIGRYAEKYLYQYRLDENSSCEARSLDTDYIFVDRYNAQSGNVFISSFRQEFDYTSNNDIVLTIDELNTYAKMKAIYDNATVERASGLVMPADAKVYHQVRWNYQYKHGKSSFFFDERSALFLQSYLLNNPNACPEQP